MSVKLFQVVMVIMMGGLNHSYPLEAGDRYRRDLSNGNCKLCPAGQYLALCHMCAPCSDGYYTEIENTEFSCHPCSNDCRKELYMEIVKPCTKTADVVCRCMPGYKCTKRDPINNQCNRCEISQASITTVQPTVRNIFTSTTTSTTLAPGTKHKDSFEFWIIVVVLLSVLVCIITILHSCRQRKKECLKQLVKRCSLGNQKEDITTLSQVHQSIQQIHAPETPSYANTQTSSSSDSPTHQPCTAEPPPPPPGNLGPLHIYGAGTVFVSLLNQFSESGGERDEVELRRQAANNIDTHCPSSPTLPLSKEEWNSGFTSFPSQEQGKECHVSKEEGL